MTLRVHCQILTLRDPEGALPAKRLSPGIDKLRNCIYRRFGNRGTFVGREAQGGPREGALPDRHAIL